MFQHLKGDKKMIKLRSPYHACQMIKAQDKDSGITEYLIRKLANSKQIRSVKTGCKLLVDYDSLIAYLDGEKYSLPIEQIVIK